MDHLRKRVRGRLLALVATCVLLTVATAGGNRQLSSKGDILGTLYKPPARALPLDDRPFNRTREFADHAHFYSAVQVLTRWAESTFALTAYAHKKLTSVPDSSACVYDGLQCLFNPNQITGSGFPDAEQPAEKVLKRFALEAHMCRSASDRPTCHLDANCDWDDVTAACFLAHDPNGDMMQAIAPCRDMLYTAAAASCWRREPEPDSFLPCGGSPCRLFTQAIDSIPEDRCMPYSHAATGLKPIHTYALLKRYFGSAKMPAYKLKVADLSNITLATEHEAAGEVDGQGVPPLAAGYGNCSTAALHHAMRTMCREWDEKSCLSDERCGWMALHGVRFCVLSADTVIELLLGSSPFTRAVRKIEATCRAVTSEVACNEVVPAP